MSESKIDKEDQKPTPQQLEQQLLELEQSKQKEFAEKYQALCEEYGYMIIPQMTMQLQKKSVK